MEEQRMAVTKSRWDRLLEVVSKSPTSRSGGCISLFPVLSHFYLSPL